MKNVLFGTAIAVLGLSSCGGGQFTEMKTISNAQDSVSYAYGVMMGKNIKSQMGASSSDFSFATSTGVANSIINGAESLMTDEEINAVLSNYITNIKPAKDMAAEATFVEKAKAKSSDIITTESGLMYEIIEAGDASTMPLATDTVSVLYTGTFIDGTVFDSSEKNDNKPMVLALNNFIPGFTEGVQLIGKGGKIKLMIPRNLGYGDALRMFEVELVDITEAPAAGVEVK